MPTVYRFATLIAGFEQVPSGLADELGSLRADYEIKLAERMDTVVHRVIGDSGLELHLTLEAQGTIYRLLAGMIEEIFATAIERCMETATDSERFLTAVEGLQEQLAEFGSSRWSSLVEGVLLPDLQYEPYEGLKISWEIMKFELYKGMEPARRSHEVEFWKRIQERKVPPLASITNPLNGDQQEERADLSATVSASSKFLPVSDAYGESAGTEPRKRCPRTHNYPAAAKRVAAFISGNNLAVSEFAAKCVLSERTIRKLLNDNNLTYATADAVGKLMGIERQKLLAPLTSE